MVTLRDVHQRNHLLDRHALVRVDGECRILFCLKQIDQVVLQLENQVNVIEVTCRRAAKK